MDNLYLEEAIAHILAACQGPAAEEEIPVSQALGRILAGDIQAGFPIPPFPRSPLDGYALRSADIRGASPENPVSLTVTETILAGDTPRFPLMPGLCARIMTGAMIPEGADCVIRQEDTDMGKERVSISNALSPWQNYCFAGEDTMAEDVVMRAGERLSYVHLGVLAGLGLCRVPVFALPKIALITTGSEVVEPGLPLPPGKIYNSNLALIQARLESLGLPPFYTAHVGDSVPDCCEKIRQAVGLGAHLILTTGGVSVGQMDILHEVFVRLPAQKIFWRVNLKPGSPALFGLYGSTPLLSLSGNPFAALATFELLARPALAALSGNPGLNLRPGRGILTGSFDKRSPGRRFLRARCHDGLVTLPETKRHSSGMLSSALGCNCLVDIPAGSPPLPAGSPVSLLFLEPEWQK